MWQDLGSPIGEARAALLDRRDARAAATRDHLVAEAEQRLFDAGASGCSPRPGGRGGPGSPIAITTLGGFRVSRDGTPIDLGDWGSRKARDLLKLLVARRGAPVVRDEAATLLWPDEPDRSARRLSVLLSTIRSMLDPRSRGRPTTTSPPTTTPCGSCASTSTSTSSCSCARPPRPASCWRPATRAKAEALLTQGRQPATSASSAPTTRTPTGLPGCASWLGTRSSSPPVSLAAPRRRARRPRRGGTPPPAHPRRRPVRRSRPPRPDPFALGAAPPRRGPPRLPHLLRPPRRARRRPGAVPRR